MRPLCGSQTTNPLPAARCNRNKPQPNNNTTPAIIFRSDHVVTPVFPPPRPTGCGGCGHRVTAVIAWGKRPVPSRTRKLRPTAPMVLHPGGCGRVGHRRNTIQVEDPQPRLGVLPHLTPTTQNGTAKHVEVLPPKAPNTRAGPWPHRGYLAFSPHHITPRQDRRPGPWATPRPS